MRMTSPHPRRTVKGTSSPMTLRSAATSNISMSPQKLRKGATFHNPPSPISDNNFVVPCLPRRSQTSLEDVVEAHKRRVALTLDDIDRGLSAVDLGTPQSTNQSFRDDSLPVPQGFLNHTVDTHRLDTRAAMSPIVSQDAGDFTVGGRSQRSRRHTRRQSNHHASDSGLGSSIMSATEGKKGAVAGLTCLTDEQGAKSMVSASAITRSAAPHRSATEKLPRLSERATNKIYEFILKPLLATPSLKDFHPLVADCPRRINEKEIVCLRDLEKTLMFMAPVSDIHNDDDAVRAFTHWFSSRLKERSNTAKLYLEFCLTSIRCIQATVEYLNDRERTRPHDRPYTSGYFIDLVDQIRNYAQSVQATKAKEKEGESLDEMDVDPSEQVKLYGGIAKNGRPAELVRVKKDGTAVSLATGELIKMESIEEDEKGGVMMKRSLSVLEDDEESVMRSMARRKRSATAEITTKKCREPGCSKEFKRSCDLTKHEKTHSRPWKCQEESCKYHEYGWPTEKELDRHVNDKHSATPKLYKCQFPPCPYQSKRESNCKQHMEKSHNWVYVRSKNNGKNRDQPKDTLPTPQASTIQTPDTENQPTPEENNWEMDDESPVLFNRNIYGDNQHMDFPSYPTDFQYGQDLSMQHFNISPVLSDLPYDSSLDASPYLDNHQQDFPMDDVTANFGADFAAGGGNDFTLYEDLYSAQALIPQHQLPTPDHSIFARSYEAPPQSYLSHESSLGLDAQISPVGHGNTMLYTPDSSCALEDFDAFMPASTAAAGNHQHDHQFGTDFALFEGGGCGGMGGGLFGELPSQGLGQGGSASQDFLTAFYTSASGQGAWAGQGMGMGMGDEGFEGGKW